MEGKKAPTHKVLGVREKVKWKKFEMELNWVGSLSHSFCMGVWNFEVALPKYEKWNRSALMDFTTNEQRNLQKNTWCFCFFLFFVFVFFFLLPTTNYLFLNFSRLFLAPLLSFSLETESDSNL